MDSMEPSTLIESEFRCVSTQERVWSSLAARSYIGSALLSFGVGSIVVCLPLLILGIALLAMGLIQRGFSLPYQLSTPFYGSIASVFNLSAGSMLLSRPQRGRQITRAILRALLQSVSMFVIMVALSITVVAFTWNRFGYLATKAFPMVWALALLAMSLVLLIATAGQPLRGAGLRPLVALVGRLLVHTGWVVLVFSLLIFPASLGLASVAFASPDWLLLATAGAVAAPVLMVAGLIMISPQKRLVLFLRRFGNEDINGAIRHAVRWHLGSSYRLITLDDLSFRPVGSPPVPKVIAVGTIFAVLTFALLAEIGIAWTLDQISVASGIDTDEWVPRSIDGWETIYFTLFLRNVAHGATVVSYYVVAVGIVVGIMILLLGRRSRLSIRGADEFRKLERQVGRLTTWWRKPRLFAPQASVVKVVNPLWRPAVTLLLRHVQVVLVDISVPSSSIIWELRCIRENSAAKPILLARRDLLIGWVCQASIQDSMQSETLAAARGLPLITYSAADRLDVDAMAAAMSDSRVSLVERSLTS